MGVLRACKMFPHNRPTPTSHLFTEYLTRLVSHGTYFENRSDQLTPRQDISATRDRGAWAVVYWYIFQSPLFQRGKTEALLCRFPPRKYFHCGWSPATSLTWLNSEREERHAMPQQSKEVPGEKANSQLGEGQARRKQLVLIRPPDPVWFFLWQHSPQLRGAARKKSNLLYGKLYYRLKDLQASLWEGSPWRFCHLQPNSYVKGGCCIRHV